MLCNRNVAISHLQTEMGFVEDFRYTLLLVGTRLNMLFSPTLPATTTQEVMLKMKILSNINVISEHQKCYAKAKQC